MAGKDGSWNGEANQIEQRDWEVAKVSRKSYGSQKRNRVRRHLRESEVRTGLQRARGTVKEDKNRT